MAYIPVPKDLTKVKSKFLFGLTKRQVVCFGLGALVGIPVFFLLKGTIGNSLASMVMMITMLPFFLFAMYERHGQPMEVIVRNMIQAKFVRPKKRIYQTENFYGETDRSIRLRRKAYHIVQKQKDPKPGKK